MVRFEGEAWMGRDGVTLRVVYHMNITYIYAIIYIIMSLYNISILYIFFI